jgi:hypothetical protein
MTHQKSKLAVLTCQLDSLYLALGLSVIKVKEMQGALKKGALEELKVTALQMKEHLQKLQRLQREVFSELDGAGVFGRKAQPGRAAGRRVRASVSRKKVAARLQ